MSHFLNRMIPAGAFLAWLAASLALAAAASPAAAQSNDPSFNLVNRSGQTINEIYVSGASQNNWGRDWLGQNVLPNGQSWPIRIPQGQECTNDIRVVYANGSADERRRVNTCNLTEVVFGTQAQAPQGPQGPQATPPAAAQNPSFNLVNNSGRTINEVYVSLATDNNWGADRLGQNVLPAGQSFAVRLPVGDCVYDIRVVYNDNSAAEKRRVNTCELTNVTFP
jgi:hypothetical protein